jgi:hypothetical protein
MQVRWQLKQCSHYLSSRGFLLQGRSSKCGARVGLLQGFWGCLQLWEPHLAALLYHKDVACSITTAVGKKLFQVALSDQAEAAAAAPSLSLELYVLDLASKLEDSILGDDSNNEDFYK